MLLKREGEWERRKEKNQLWDAGKLKNRKITFLVQADRTYLLHFFSSSTIFLLHEIWCWNVCSSSFQLLLSVLTLLSQKISFILHVTLCAPTFYSLSLTTRYFLSNHILRLLCTKWLNFELLLIFTQFQSE